MGKEKISDEVNIYRGLTYNPSDLCDYGDKVRVLRSSNINDVGFILNNNDVFVKRNAINIDYAEEGDILITSANGSSNLVGKHAIIRNIKPNSTVHGGFMLLGKTKNSYFINASMDSNWYKKFICINVSGGNGAIGNLKKSDFDNQFILVPSIEEQKQIGSLFKNLDEKLEIEREKHEKLVNFKKAMLENFFPKEGEKRPKIRFGGYNDDWEETSLEKLGLVQSGYGFPLNEQGGTSGVPYIKVSDMNGKNNSTFINIANNYVDEKQILKNNWKKLSGPSIIFAKVGAAVLLDRKRIVLDSFLIDNNMMSFSPFDKSNIYFYKLLFETITLAKLIQTGALPSLSASDIYNKVVAIPSIEEQKLIGSFFKNLDEKIQVSEEKITKIENFKKAMMYGLFV